MKLTVEIQDGILLELAKDIMQNYPEYSDCNALQCVGWKYEKGVYVFEDEEEENKRYTITVEEIAAKGLPMFIEKTLSGEIKFCGLSTLDECLDAGCYDCPAVDAVVQYTVFGELIYG